MVIDIDEAQTEVLREVLEARLGNLSSEIRHTDTPRVRQELREEREAIRSLLLSIKPTAA